MKKVTTIAVAVVIAVMLTLLFVGGTLVFAHSSGESFEKTVDGYLVDIGYSVEKFTDDSSVVFDFGLVDPSGDAAEFSDVWVRIVRTNAKETVFAGGVNNARLGGTVMTYVFPETGEYELSARYQNNEESIVEAVFPLIVYGAFGSSQTNHVVYATMGFAGGFILSMALMLFLRHRKK